MRIYLSSLVALCLCATSALAGGKGKVLFDLWDAAYMGDGKAGYVHTQAMEIDVDGQKRIQTTLEVRLTVKRFSDTMEMAADTGTTETPEGTVVGTFMKQYQAKKQQTQIEGAVVGKQLHLTLNGNTPLKPAPWNSEVVGLYKQEYLFKDRDLSPGAKFTFLSFEPFINNVLKTEAVVRGERQVLLKGAKKKEKLTLVEIIPEKVEFKPGQKIQLPIKQIWLNDKYEVVKSEVEIPGLGPIVTYRMPKAQAMAAGPPAQLVDLGFNQLVKLKNRINFPHETTAATYRVTIRNEDDVKSAFSNDERQMIKEVKGNSFELHIKAVNGSTVTGEEKEADPEFIQSCYYINSDDAVVKERTSAAIGKEVDPWKKAVRIERWVHQNMRFTNDETLATADHVARTLQGDCTEYAMLAAAMCRAAGVPSRTAIGLIYADVKGAPVFAFHMWTEVWIKGRWIPIDATLGRGYVGAAHLKITDNSWHDERTMTPIFPVVRVVGRVSIDVLNATNR
jgi:transglutaminase-like putative cysteine protease